MKSVDPKSLLPISLLLLLLLSSCPAQPLKEHQEREQRQLKGQGATTEADVKMMTGNMANMTPGMQMPGMSGMTGLSMNPMANMQLARYPNYPSMLLGAGGLTGSPFLGMPGQLGPQSNIANNYPADPSMGLGLGLGLPGSGTNFGLGLGVGLGGYPGNPPNAGFMYGNSQGLYPNAHLGQGFGAQPPLDNFGPLNNIVNQANLPGLSGALNAGGLYGQPGGPLGMPGYFGGGLDHSMIMHNYAPAF
ncbi:collagen alpha-2(IV) chain [Drosophila grimshawi]|uniref:GH21949 n=1 Tax=Drosophila grimshawi TaxID=7222 RepID=B4J8R5_DROGR|nr:collagen alpha-2(IV) chain [Drosophila grimshawi]EDW02355.1 GH21949 [Drosophila grimshawi]